MQSKFQEREFYSREEGDLPLFTDAQFNFVPGAAFEIGVSLAVLDHPGKAGLLLDGLAVQIKKILDSVFDSSLGEEIVPLHSKLLHRETLRVHIQKRMIEILHPKSAQLGHCSYEDLSDPVAWMNEGLNWLKETLLLSSNSESYTYQNMLTKIRVIDAFGGILRDLMMTEQGPELAARMLGQPVFVLHSRFEQITTKIFHYRFNQPFSRARSEKVPLIFHEPLTKKVNASLVSATPHRLGFGQIFHLSRMSGDERFIREHERLVSELGREVMPRIGQDIQDLYSPGLLGESSKTLLPMSFIEAGLLDALISHRYFHGNGLNRWQLKGSYAKEAWNHHMPAAGSQSAEVVAFFIALNCLSNFSFFGKSEALLAGLMVSAFMNMGGYHSFVETFPIAQAVALDKVFRVTVTAQQKTLYTDILRTLKHNHHQKSLGAAFAYFRAYQKSIALIQRNLKKSDDQLLCHQILKTGVWKVPTIALSSFLNADTVSSFFSTGEPILGSNLRYTILDNEHVVFRDVHELAELLKATSRPGHVTAPIELVSFRPERVALHQVIASIIARVQYIPVHSDELSCVQHDAIFLRIIKTVLAEIEDDLLIESQRLMLTRKDIESYVVRHAPSFMQPRESVQRFFSDKKLHAYDEVINECVRLLNPNAVLGMHVSGYSMTQALVALATDKIYNNLVTDAMTYLVDLHINQLICQGKLTALEPPPHDKRELFLIAGGQASGKGAAYAIFRYSIEKNGIDWCNVSKGGGDTFRSLLLNPKTVHPELFEQLSSPEASYVSHKLVKEKLEAMIHAGLGPYIFIEQMYLGADKLELALLNGGCANVIFVSTAVEKAIVRSFSRGLDIGRYETVKGILKAHRGSTEQLPACIQKFAGQKVYIQIIDNNGPKDAQPIPVAHINCEERAVIILDREKMMEFIKKIAINIDATSLETCYLSSDLASLDIEAYFSLPDFAFYYHDDEKLSELDQTCFEVTPLLRIR